MTKAYRRRRVFVVVFALALVFLSSIDFSVSEQATTESPSTVLSESTGQLAVEALEDLPVKGRAPSTGYSRDEFGGDWSSQNGCDTRNIILFRDLIDTKIDGEQCHVLSGILNDPYTGKVIQFARGAGSSDVQIDHVVALSDAWQKGAQQLSYENRVKLANDPLELLAVDGPANQQKSGSDAASWLPPNKAFRCQYVARQIAVKLKYDLWVSEPEKTSMLRVLSLCPRQVVSIE